MSRIAERGPRVQRGFALLVTLLVLVIGAATLFVSTRQPATNSTTRDPAASVSLAQARDAVVAYAQYGGSNNKPGALPCPDTSDPGDTANRGQAGSHCQGSPDPVYLGRLPWRTIDFAAGADERGMGVWYAIDGDYQDDPGDPPVLNAETPAELELYGADTSGSGRARVAVLILAGPPLAGQSGRPGTDAGDYLEGENADGDRVFQDCADVAACNDRIIGVRRDRLFAGVQRRALAAIEDRLRRFEDNKGYLPYAAAFGAGLSCDAGERLGRLALSAGDCGANATLTSDDFDPDSVSPEPDPYEWIVDNDWPELVVYHVDSVCTDTQSDCPAGGFELDADTGLALILGGAGSAHSGQARPGTAVSDYLDRAVNQDGDGAYEDGPLTPADNDVFRGVAFPP